MPQAPVPTRADFLARCAKPECFSGIDTAIVDAVLADETDSCAAYYGDRATLPLVEVDGGFVRAVVRRAALELMSSRGFNRQAGADGEIVKSAERATAWLEGVAAKEIHPHYVDSTPNVADDGPLAATSTTSDAWTQGCRPSPGRCC